MTITAADVNKLRQMTGAGMMDCKKALQESEGDFDKAIDYLRKKGQKVAGKRADRDANQGFVCAKTTADQTFGAVIMVNCETDFVGKTEDFINFSRELLDLGINKRIKTAAELLPMTLGTTTVEERLNEMLGKTGEKIQIAHFEAIEAPVVFAYNHFGNRLATVIGLNKKDGKNVMEIGHELAMQVAAMSPVAVDKENVTQEVIDREMEIGKEQARQEGKPEEMLDKIATGKLQKFFKEMTLLNQDFVKDTKKTVRQYIADHDKELMVTGFKRLQLGA
ncbi:MAG TPA: translation elongation factor Ts [Bacteroidales bacterium]|nr:translation elongation factor Ts [Bacteroidales bacterium]HPS49747.1 translation elongation factor Ts [Bacteroidales bacterium]